MRQPTTKCIIHGADKDEVCFIFAQHHGLYINVVESRFSTNRKQSNDRICKQAGAKFKIKGLKECVAHFPI
jgi:hypothetical protein